jgi:hypothetical protein
VEPTPGFFEEDDFEEVGRPEGPPGAGWDDLSGPGSEAVADVEPPMGEPWTPPVPIPEQEMEPMPSEPEAEPRVPEAEDEPPYEEDVPSPGIPPADGGPPAEPRFGRRARRR